ncbi:hypothetical protein M427DRAFT_354938 [Gonapodya prolifera JEL478]|uniref:Uncharacterized protein n=1 Tax=Gonapodya prolifera (strain JEL478) TaxID=1344416 RepID=A0A139ABJ9_GONPJ|nr:hypothetical protein M427DRAFT_354938 [Gonapodya prolifera JEL478]|eukprot:KXS14130.1 hypothetical protein M427DRAFT_354938 [Gonapodya prolifera JEL478]
MASMFRSTLNMLKGTGDADGRGDAQDGQYSPTAQGGMVGSGRGRNLVSSFKGSWTGVCWGKEFDSPKVVMEGCGTFDGFSPFRNILQRQRRRIPLCGRVLIQPQESVGVCFVPCAKKVLTRDSNGSSLSSCH